VNRTGSVQGIYRGTGFCFISHFPSLSNLISRERSYLLSLVSLLLLRRDSRLRRGCRRALAAALPRRNKKIAFFLEFVSTIPLCSFLTSKKPRDTHSVLDLKKTRNAKITSLKDRVLCRGWLGRGFVWPIVIVPASCASSLVLFVVDLDGRFCMCLGRLCLVLIL